MKLSADSLKRAKIESGKILTVKEKIQRLKSVLDNFGIANNVYNDNNSINYRLKDIIIAGRDDYVRKGVEYQYIFSGFKVQIELGDPPVVKPTSAPGYLTSGFFIDTNHKRIELNKYFLETGAGQLGINLEHPHFAGGKMCLGIGFQDDFRACIATMDYIGLINSIFSSIIQYSPRNPYRKLMHEMLTDSNGRFIEDKLRYFIKPKPICKHCKTELSDGVEEKQCRDCNYRYCTTCARTCILCNDTGCPRCVSIVTNECNHCTENKQKIECSHCHTLHHIFDSSVCPNCDSIICDDCLRVCDVCFNNTCANCQCEHHTESIVTGVFHE